MVTALGEPPGSLISHAGQSQLGIDDRAGRTVWWHRPHAWTLAMIGQRTGVKRHGWARWRSMRQHPVYLPRGRRYGSLCRTPARHTRPTGEPIGLRFVDHAWKGIRSRLCGSNGQIGWLAVARSMTRFCSPAASGVTAESAFLSYRFAPILPDNLHSMWRKPAWPSLSDGASRGGPAAGRAAQGEA